MSDPNNPPPSDDDWGSGGEEWGQPQRPQQPPPQGQGGYAPPPPPPGSGGYPAPTPQPPYGQQPGRPVGPGGQNVPNYLVHSILATVFCCLPTGIVGIVFASQVNSKLAQGDFAGAKKASDNARLWSIISVGAGVLIAIIWVLAAVSSGTGTV